MNNGIILGLRILAFMIDIGIGAGIIALSFMGLEFITESINNNIMGVFTLILFPIILTTPIIYMGLATGVFGKTLGKWICRLEVVDDNNNKLSIWKSLGREAIKVFMVVSNIGLIVYIIQVAINGKLFHDHICHTDVNFIGGLTDTQKHWRKYHNKNNV